MSGRIISVTPSSLQSRLAEAHPGDIVLLEPGLYSNRFDFNRLRGAPGLPITLRGQAGVFIDGGRRFEDFRLEANREARRVQDGREYPGLYKIADHAQWRFFDCEWLVVEHLAFRGCWPTCIYISGSRSLVFSHLDIEEGTFAFYAAGVDTRDITVEHCSWVQDVSPGHDLWSSIGWKKVHDDQPVADDDARAYDGDFFRAYAIAGRITIRDNRIRDAFNGVHLFNHEDQPATNLNRDVWVYRNKFVRIRDNPIEPEVAAFNWWVFHNTFHNCHAWFSLELALAAHIYIFANVGWFDDMPGPISDDTFGGAVIKLDKKQRVTARPGPHYFFNNSWYLRSAYIKNGAITNFHHFNNAAIYCRSEDHGSHDDEPICSPTRRMFWESGNTPAQNSFTRDWLGFNITFENDMISHRDFPATLISAGYSINNGFGQSPGFIQPASGMFRLCECAAARGRGMGVALLRPRPHAPWHIQPDLDLGAYQGERFLQPPADFAEPSVPDTRMDPLIAEAKAAGPLTRRFRRTPT